MFGKLVKHELRATARIIPFVFLVTIFLALVHVVTAKLNLDRASQISLVLMIIMCISQSVVATVLVIWRYYKSMYSNEAYLTHSLPVHPSRLLWSKLLVGFLWTICSIVISLSVFAVVIITEFIKSSDPISEISTAYQSLLTMTGLQNQGAVVWIILAVYIVLGSVMFLAEAYFAVTVGNLSKLHSLGIGGPILVYFAEYIVLEIVGSILTIFVPLSILISTSADGTKTGIKLVAQNMASTLGATFGNTGYAGTGSEPVLIGIGYYIVIPFIAAGLLLLTSRIITRHTSVK